MPNKKRLLRYFIYILTSSTAVPAICSEPDYPEFLFTKSNEGITGLSSSQAQTIQRPPSLSNLVSPIAPQTQEPIPTKQNTPPLSAGLIRFTLSKPKPTPTPALNVNVDDIKAPLQHIDVLEALIKATAKRTVLYPSHMRDELPERSKYIEKNLLTYLKLQIARNWIKQTDDKGYVILPEAHEALARLKERLPYADMEAQDEEDEDALYLSSFEEKKKTRKRQHKEDDADENQICDEDRATIASFRRHDVHMKFLKHIRDNGKTHAKKLFKKAGEPCGSLGTFKKAYLKKDINRQWIKDTPEGYVITPRGQKVLDYLLSLDTPVEDRSDQAEPMEEGYDDEQAVYLSEEYAAANDDDEMDQGEQELKGAPLEKEKESEKPTTVNQSNAPLPLFETLPGPVQTLVIGQFEQEVIPDLLKRIKVDTSEALRMATENAKRAFMDKAQAALAKSYHLSSNSLVPEYIDQAIEVEVSISVDFKKKKRK